MPDSIKCVAYCRVSTLLGQDPQNQLVPIKQFCLGRNFQIVNEYVDHVSGATERRKALDQLIRDARMGKFKVVVISALDRLARDVRFLLNLLHELDGYGVTVCSLRESLDFGTPIGRACLGVIGVISQLEREIISERIKTALAVKKLTSQKTGSGWRCGRPALPEETASNVRILREQGKSIRVIAKQLGIGKTSVERVLRGHR